jgi:hypothetical protein
VCAGLEIMLCGSRLETQDDGTSIYHCTCCHSARAGFQPLLWHGEQGVPCDNVSRCQAGVKWGRGAHSFQPVTRSTTDALRTSGSAALYTSPSTSTPPFDCTCAGSVSTSAQRVGQAQHPTHLVQSAKVNALVDVQAVLILGVGVNGSCLAYQRHRGNSAGWEFRCLNQKAAICVALKVYRYVRR